MGNVIKIFNDYFYSLCWFGVVVDFGIEVFIDVVGDDIDVGVFVDFGVDDVFIDVVGVDVGVDIVVDFGVDDGFVDVISVDDAGVDVETSVGRKVLQG